MNTEAVPCSAHSAAAGQAEVSGMFLTGAGWGPAGLGELEGLGASLPVGGSLGLLSKEGTAWAGREVEGTGAMLFGCHGDKWGCGRSLCTRITVT